MCRPLPRCDRDEARYYWHYCGTTSPNGVLKISSNTLISLEHLKGFEFHDPQIRSQKHRNAKLKFQ
jgi:hypothetical protein